MRQSQVLFISYNGILEPLLNSQGLPYIKGLLRRTDLKFILLTFEKKQNLKRYGYHYLKGLKNDLKKQKIEWHFLCYHKKPSLLATVFDVINGLILSLVIIIFKRIRLIHARGIVSASIALGLYIIFRTKFIFDMRNFLAEAYVSAGTWKKNSLNFKLVKFMEKWALRMASETIVESNYHYKILEKDNYRNVNIIPCCVDLEKFRYEKEGKKFIPENDFGLDNRFYLVYIGSLGTWYMMDEMLDFFKAMIRYDGFVNSNFIIVSYFARDLIIKSAKRKGIDAEKIKILHLPHSQVPSILSLCNLGIVFIRPYERMDSFPTKIGEYLACGLPIVLNKGMGDAEEMVKENKVGVVIDKFEEDEYIGGICKLRAMLRDDNGLRDRCRKVAEDNISLEKGIEKYYQIYSRLIN